MQKVSIITATFNSAKTLQNTIESVMNQSYTSIEHLIIDGLSKDNTMQVVQAYPHLSVYQEKDKGIYDAMNKGVTKASGQIVAILNSDDFYASNDVIKNVVDLFEKTNCDAVYGDLVYVDEENTNKVVRHWKAGNFRYGKFKWGWMPPHPTVFVKKEVYLKHGLFNLSLTSAADYELMLRFMYKHKINVQYLPQLLVKMRVGGKSNKSLKNRLIANAEDRQAWQINGLKPYFFTLTLKPLRKISQFIFK